MKLLSERNQVREVRDRWNQQYRPGYHSPYFNVEAIREKLAALDLEIATAADVREAIGNWSWVQPQTCNECGTENWDIVEIGGTLNYESKPAQICKPCMHAAIALIDGAPNSRGRKG